MPTTASASSADIEAGRVVSTQCAICHGSDGEGIGVPKSCISCLDPKTFAKHIRDFQNGKRRNYMMEIIAKKLSDKDIKNLAAYYSTIHEKAEKLSSLPNEIE